jgi:hypothetical protein
MDQDKETQFLDGLAVSKEGAGFRPALTLDVALYQAWLDGAELSDAEREAFLESLWSIMVAFVDLGFGVHPMQQAAPAICGQICEFDDDANPDVLSSLNKSVPTQFTSAARPQQRIEAARKES